MQKILRNIFPAIKSSAVAEAGWIKGELVKAGEFDKIRELTAEARKLVDSIRK